jgi:VanZ family protein
LWLSLRPLQESVRFFFLPEILSNWLDAHDRLVNFFAFLVFTWITIKTFDVKKPSVFLTILFSILSLMTLIEFMQIQIAGRSVDAMDVISGFWGSICAVFIGAFSLKKSPKSQLLS